MMTDIQRLKQIAQMRSSFWPLNQQDAAVIARLLLQVLTDQGRLTALATSMNAKSAQLQAALNNVNHPKHFSKENLSMASPIDTVIAAATAENTVVDSAIVFINSVPGLIQAGIQQALAGGATAAQLAPLNDLATEMDAKKAALQAALTANTPTPPPGP